MPDPPPFLQGFDKYGVGAFDAIPTPHLQKVLGLKAGECVATLGCEQHVSAGQVLRQPMRALHASLQPMGPLECALCFVVSTAGPCVRFKDVVQ